MINEHPEKLHILSRDVDLYNRDLLLEVLWNQKIKCEYKSEIAATKMPTTFHYRVDHIGMFDLENASSRLVKDFVVKWIPLCAKRAKNYGMFNVINIV